MDRVRVLIVEDEKIVQRLCQRLLSNLDCELSLAGTVSEGVKTIEECAVDILITDLKLPDGTGVEVIRKFKEKFRDKQVIIMTGSLTPEERLSHADCIGGSHYLLKPFDINEFKGVVSNAVHDLAA